MKTTAFIGYVAVSLLLAAVGTSSASAQITVTVLGSMTEVVQYDTGSATKFYQRNTTYAIGRDAGWVQSNPASRNDTWRSIVEFWLHGSGIVRGSTINSACLVVTIGGSTYNAKIVAIDSSQNMINLENIWLNVGQSSTTYFNVPYGTTSQQYCSSQLKTAVQNHVYNGTFRVGIMSLSESTNKSATTALVNLLVNYTPPPGKITVQNSFGGGKIKVDGDSTVESGRQFTWSAGSQHTLEALDQIWPASSGKNRTFDDRPDKGWQKKVGSNPPEVITTSRSFTYTVQAGESATLEAQFKTSITVSGTLTIASGTLYTIEPNTTVNCEPGSKIVVNGSLQAVGKEGERIVFTSPNQQSWQGIEFNGDGGSVNGSSLQYCDIRYASLPIKTTNKPNLHINQVTIGNSSFYNGSDNAAMAFYNSLPSIRNVTINGQSNSWNGVRFAQGSRGSIWYSTIRQLGAGNGIVVQGNSYPQIMYSNIDSNYYHGIIVVSNGVQTNGPNNPYIYGNNLRRNGFAFGTKYYNGIDVYASSAHVRWNAVSHSNWGVICNQAGIIWTEEVNAPWWELGANVLTNNVYGLAAYNGSTIFFGRAVVEGGTTYYYGACNKIHSNDTYDAVAASSSVVKAQGNWWGQYPPNYSKIFVSNAWLDVDPARQWEDYCDPDWGGGGARIAPAGSSTSSSTMDGASLLEAALNAYVQQDYAKAATLYRTVLTTSDALHEQQRALAGLYHVFGATKDEALLVQMNAYASQRSEMGYIASLLHARMNLALQRYGEAVASLQRLRSQARGTEYEKHALITLASLGGFSESQRTTAQQYLTELVQRYSATVDKGLLVALGATVGEGSAKIASGESGQRELTISNYPNPFNPATVIRFTLPEAGHTSLKVFDLLGREVASLLNEHRAAGSHQVQFDASALPSGVYFYRLESAGRVMIQKMVLAR